MQLRYATYLTVQEYVRQEAWKDATIEKCPLHPKGCCGFCRHGTYNRKFPDGAKIARWYCPDGRQTFSMLPDCLSAKLPGTLDEVEAVINKVENSKSQESAADELRPDIELPGALRWVRRRILLVRTTLVILTELFPNLFVGCNITLSSFRSALSVVKILSGFRELAGSHLYSIPPPVGFGPSPKSFLHKKNHFQHKMGTDPPSKII